MIDQTTTDYDQPAVYLPRLIDWAQCGAIHYSETAANQRRLGQARNAQSYEALAAEWRRIAKRAEERLTALTAAPEPTTADAPPASLTGLTDWLRARVGRYFPRLPVEAWQTVAAIMLWGRAS